MLQRLTTAILFLVLILFVSMLGVNEASAITPNPPNSFTISNLTHKSYTVSWSGGPGVSWSVIGYGFISRVKGTADWTSVAGAPFTDTSLTFPSLTPSTTYEYRVQTYAQNTALLFLGQNVQVWSSWSAVQEVTTKANQAPEIKVSIPNRTLKFDTTTTIDMSSYISDPDGDTLTYTYAISNSGSDVTCSFVGSKLTINAGSTAGTATITVTATDTYNASVTQSFTVTAEPYYTPEPVGTIPDKTLKVGSTGGGIPGSLLLDMSLQFTHRDNDTMTYSATLSDTSIGTVSWAGSFLRITNVAAGSATVTVTATDSRSATATQTFSLTVLPNSAPTTVGSIPNQTLSLSDTGIATVDVNSYFSDPDGNLLTYSATSSDTSIATASIATVSTSEATLTITGVADGSATITVMATDTANATATQDISVSVTSNRAPVRTDTIPTQTVSLSGSAETVDLDSYFSDPDGNPLTYSATSSNTSRATVSVSGATLTITGVATGSATITVNATDPSNAGATQSFSVSVVANRSPISVGPIPNQTVRVGDTAVTVDVSSYFSDPDGNPLTYSATSSNTSKATVSVSGSTVTITAVAAGSATISVTATDPSNASRSRSFSATVLASNKVSGVGTIPNQTLSLSGTDTATIDVSGYFSGPVDDTLTYSATSSSSSKATVSLSGATLTITGVAAGSSTIRVTATSSANTSATQTFSVRVYSNRAPTTVGTISAKQISNSAVDSLNVADYFSDPDGNTLTYTASSSNESFVEVNVMNTSTLNILANGLGTVTVTVKATDPSSASATQSFSVTVIAQAADALPGLSSDELSQLGALVTDDTLIFNELHNGSDDANDWLELRNVSAANLPLDRWELSMLMSDGNVVVPFPAGTVVPVGGVLLLVNTENTTADMREGLLTPIPSVVVETFALPQAEFALILQGPSGIGDLAVNYFQMETESASETAPVLTVDTVWHRNQPVVSGYLAAAWSSSTQGTPGYRHATEMADLNNDGAVDILDLVLVASQFGMNATPAADLNSDGAVNIQDLVLVANVVNGVAAAPTAQQSQASVVNNWLRLARQNATGVVQTAIPEGFSYARGIFTLEQLARSFVPETTALLANYPNPFNPETWIPYQLSKATDVTVHIYATDGSVVRTLALGHQDAGMYHNRSQAAYWDGRNAFGETVASGVYFYTLTAGEFTATRKMLILK